MGNKFFTSKLFYILTSVFFAIVLFFNANATSIRNQGMNQAGEVYTATITNVPVELKYDTNKYFVSGYNSSATVHLSGYNRISITNEENPDTRNFFLSIDLTGVKTGKVDVPVRIEQLPGGVNASIEPKTMNVTVEKRATQEFDITTKVDSTQLPTGFTVDSFDLSENKANVVAGQESIKKIYAIEAAIPSDVTLNDNYSGTITLHAVDRSGAILPAQISPATVHAKVSVNKPSKQVPVKVKMTGVLDQSLSEIKTKLSDATVTISGEQNQLDEVSSLDAIVNIAGVTKETKVSVSLSASGLSIRPQTVDVTLTPVKKK